MAAKKKQLDFTQDPPKTLTDQPFYGLVLDEEQLNLANAIWDQDIDIVFVNAAAGTGKAQPVNTMIPTPVGNRRFGDIKPGNYVYARDGTPTKVLGVFNQGELDAYEITLSDGRKTICNGEHLWTYYGNSGQLVTETLNSMLSRSISRGSNGYRYGIPVNSAVYHEEKELPVDPYVVGAFIGDGCCTDRVLTISSDDEEVVEKISTLIGAKRYKKASEENYCWMFELPDELQNDRRKLFTTKEVFNDIPCVIGDSYGKRIPKIYLNSSYEQRMRLLHGLMDTDGCIVESFSGGSEITGEAVLKYSVRYTTVNKGIVDDVTDLIRGLGYVCKVRETYNEKYRFGVCYDICFIISNQQKKDLFSLKRKREIAERAYECDNFRKYDRVWIKDVKKLDKKIEMMCIYVDNPEHLYLTNDYIVTHNTTIATGVANMLVQYGKYDGIIYIMSPYGERKQGYIPGSITEKSSVYFEAFYQALTTCGINPNTAINDESMVNQKNGTGYITCITDTFLRGSNLDNAVIIIDEAQNYTVPQLQKTLTRVGSHAKVIVIGHTLQCDLDKPELSGFDAYIEHFKLRDRCAVCELKTNHRGWISSWADKIGAR